MKFAVVVFPGIQLRPRRATTPRSTCSASRPSSSGTRTRACKGADVVILPGGFAHGDYLRTGAIARFSPIMAEVQKFADARRTGARHLQRLPGAARGGPAAGRDAAEPQPASSSASTCTSRSSRPTRRSPRPAARPGAAHSDRARRGQLLRGARRARAARAEPPGRSSATRTPTAWRPTRRIQTDRSTNIAGLCNEQRNVVGLMPHPERACELALGSADGLILFESVVARSRHQGRVRRRRTHDYRLRAFSNVTVSRRTNTSASSTLWAASRR